MRAQQVRQFLFQVNRLSPKVQWNLNRVEYATRHLVSGINGGPSHYETRWNVKYSIDVTLEGGPAVLPAAAGTAAFGLQMPVGAMVNPDPLVPVSRGPASPTAPAFVHGMGYAQPGSPR